VGTARNAKKRRPLTTAIAAAALYAGVLVPNAAAETHELRVTLVTGQQLLVTAEVPPGTALADVTLPALPAAVASLEDLGPVATPTPSPTVTASPSPTPTQSPTPTPSATPAPRPTPANRDQGDSDRGSATAPRRGRDRGSARPSRSRPNAESRAGQVATPEPTPAPAAPERAAPRRDAPPAAPASSLALPGPEQVGVPNFFIEQFRIPPFLLPIYQAAGTQYGIRWEVLAAINEIETDYGRNVRRSSAGAEGWMQFLPSTWAAYGVDGNRDGLEDPANPVDAIFAAARYLRAAGADRDLRGAIFAYNHADWYVDSVLTRARLIGALPSGLVGSLTGLTEGRFPVLGRARLARASGAGAQRGPGVAIVGRRGAAVVAANDARVVRMGRSPRLGRFVRVQDVYGNTYTYAGLAKVAERYAAPKPQRVAPADAARELALPRRDARPTAPASDTGSPAARTPERAARRLPAARRVTTRARAGTAAKQRLFAHPLRPRAAAAGGAQQLFLRTGRIDALSTTARPFGLPRRQLVVRPLRRGARIPAGTLLGRLGPTAAARTSRLWFEVRPAGRGAPRIDPRPILAGWRLLESTAIYRASGRSALFGEGTATPSVGQILLMGRDALARRVLADPRIQIYACGRREVQAGQIDRRVLATLELLASSGFSPTVTSLRCGHSYLTTSGNVSQHSSGNAVDIAAVNGIPILGHQGPGSITDLVIQRLLTLQGAMKPDQIISLMTFAGADNTLSLPDHADHIHVGWKPLFGANPELGRQVDAILRPGQWTRLVERLREIRNPAVRVKPSRQAVAAARRDGVR
jgi:murein DD-endopeptidase MepM/ murein hydrolase activator NlpD